MEGGDKVAKKAFFLAKNGATPTDESIQRMLRIAHCENAARKYTAISGKMVNDPAYLRRKLGSSSIIIHIDDDCKHFHVIGGREGIAKAKDALRDSEGSSWKIIQEQIDN